MKKFEKGGARVVGVSADKPEKQKKFAEKHGLRVTLLSDEGNKLATELGAYGEKKMYGKTVKGVIRSTFLIDEKGVVAKAWRGVKVDGHAEKVLEAVVE